MPLGRFIVGIVGFLIFAYVSGLLAVLLNFDVYIFGSPCRSKPALTWWTPIAADFGTYLCTAEPHD